MALSARQITLVASTITPLLVQGTTGTQFRVITGAAPDPLPVMIQITTGTVYVGGPDVSATNGLLLQPNVPMVFALYGNDIPYAFSTGTPVVQVMVGRQ
jgi:hypothetical protein